LNETSPDEDVLASDCDVTFAEASVRVQVKCSSRFKIDGRSASWKIDEHWLLAWSEAILPVYFLLVLVPRDLSLWLHHDDEGTFHRTAAFWRRLDPDETGSRVRVPKSQRLTEATLHQWHDDLLATFRAGVAQ
jgi:hypothetical protein